MGNMFSGKTSELVRRLKRLKILEKRIVVVNSAKDTRSPEQVLKTHDNVKFDCYKVLDLFELLNKDTFEDAEIIAIDEAQFFESLDGIESLAPNVVVAGLSGDYMRRPFGKILDLIPKADKVTFLKANCKCGAPASFTKKLSTGSHLVNINADYIPVCGTCY